MPPTDDIEQRLLGRMLLDQGALEKAITFPLRPSDLLQPGHQLTYQAMLSLFERSISVNPFTLTEELRRHHQLSQAGGTDYLDHLPSLAAPEQQFADLVGFLIDASLKREVISVAEDVIREASVGSTQINHLALWFEHQTRGAMASRRLGPCFETLEEPAALMLKGMETGNQEERALPALATGLAGLDRLLSGTRAGDLIAIAGPPGTGKTGLVLSIIRHMTLDRGKSVAVFSLKASTLQVTRRLAAIEAGVDSCGLVAGDMKGEDWMSVVQAGNAFAQASIYVCDSPELSDLQLRAMTHALKREHGVDLVVVDALHLVDHCGQEPNDFSNGLKALAGEIGCPVIVLLQTPRNTRGSQEGQPVLADLAVAGYPGLEKAADVVVFVRRLAREEDAPGDSAWAGEVIVARNRHGMTGAVRLTWNAECATYEHRG